MAANPTTVWLIQPLLDSVVPQQIEAGKFLRSLGSPPVLTPDCTEHLCFEDDVKQASRGARATIVLTKALPEPVPSDATIVFEQYQLGEAQAIALHRLVEQSCNHSMPPERLLGLAHFWGMASSSNPLYISPLSADAELMALAYKDFTHTPLREAHIVVAPPFHTTAGTAKFNYGLPLKIVEAERGTGAMNAMARVYERHDVVCREKQVLLRGSNT
jgi:hypothetical protein